MLRRAHAMQAGHAVGVLERVRQFVERERRAHVIHAIVADHAADALVLDHLVGGDGHPGHVQMLEALLQLGQLRIGIARLQVEDARHGRTAAHDALQVAHLLHAPDLPPLAELLGTESKIFVTRHQHDLCGACRRFAQSVHAVLPDVCLLVRGGAGNRAGSGPHGPAGFRRQGEFPRTQRRYHGLDRLRDCSSSTLS
ncbi:hypothetical protein D3C85_1120920 [compost metagenome]